MRRTDIQKIIKGKAPKNISLDKEARAIYFSFSSLPVSRTERFNNSVSIDYDKDHQIVGIEIIRVVKMGLIIKKAMRDISAILPKSLFAAV